MLARLRRIRPRLGWYDDDTLVEAAHLIRSYHDATASLLASQSARIAGLEVVCHNDLSPCNFVFRLGRPVALIDFDAAAPGPRLHDLGYAAWMWLDLGNDEIGPNVQQERLAIFVAAYEAGLEPTRIVDAIALRQQILIAQGQRTGHAAMAQWAAECLDWTSRHLRP